MSSREEYLKWASGISWTFITRVEPEDIEALCNRVWNEAMERAASEFDVAEGLSGFAEDFSRDAAAIIRELKEKAK